MNKGKNNDIPKGKTDNPLSDLISDDIYELLNLHGLINEKSVRDYKIRKKFRQLRVNKFSTGNAIEALREEYPYLQFDTIRKIVYQIYIATEKEKYKI